MMAERLHDRLAQLLLALGGCSDEVRFTGETRLNRQRLKQVIVEDANGPGARQMHPVSLSPLQLHTECIGATFFKQWGSCFPVIEASLADTQKLYEARERKPVERWLNINGGSVCTQQPVRIVPKKKPDAGNRLDEKNWQELPRHFA